MQAAAESQRNSGRLSCSKVRNMKEQPFPQPQFPYSTNLPERIYEAHPLHQCAKNINWITQQIISLANERVNNINEDTALDCFLSFDETTFQSFRYEYSKKYGAYSASYMEKYYSKWKDGSVKISDRVKIKIQSAVLAFVSNEKRLDFLRRELLNMQEINPENFRRRAYSTDDCVTIFEYIKSHIEKKTIKPDWFTTYAFSNNEIKEFIEIYQFFLLKKLQMEFSGFCRDLQVIRKFIEKIRYSAKFRYKLDLSYQFFDINNLPFPDSGVLQISALLHDFTMLQKPHFLKAIDYELLLLKQIHEKSEARSSCCIRDIDNALLRIHSAKIGEINSTIIAFGASGTIAIAVEKPDEKKLRTAVPIEMAKLLTKICLFVIFLLLMLLFSEKNNDTIDIPFVIASLFLFLFLLMPQYREFKRSVKILRNYERQAKSYTPET